MQISSYLFFDGRCDEAIEFYKKALDAKVTMRMEFKDSPMAHDPKMVPPENMNKVMHANLRIGDTEVLMSDGHCTGSTKFQGFSLVVTVSTEAEVDKRFNALAEGGSVQMPLDKTFFSARYGMCTDKFGVMWMVMVQGN